MNNLWPIVKEFYLDSENSQPKRKLNQALTQVGSLRFVDGLTKSLKLGVDEAESELLLKRPISPRPLTEDEQTAAALSASFIGLIRDRSTADDTRLLVTWLWSCLQGKVRRVWIHSVLDLAIDSYGRVVPAFVPSQGEKPAEILAKIDNFLDKYSAMVQGRRASIYFPTVWQNLQNEKEPGRMIEMASVSLSPETELAGPWTLPSNRAIQKHRSCLVAPWSLYGFVTKEDPSGEVTPNLEIEELTDSPKWQRLIQSEPGIEDTSSRRIRSDNAAADVARICIVVELNDAESLENELRKVSTLIQGMSLSLAFSLAAWASQHGKLLRRICCTAIVDTDAEGKLQHVDGIDEKMDLVKQVLFAEPFTKTRSVVIGPPGDASTIRALFEPEDPIQPILVDGEAPDSLKSLFTEGWRQIVEDFSEIRRVREGKDPPDIDAGLKSDIDKSLDATKLDELATSSRFTLTSTGFFGTDVEPLAKQVVAGIDGWMSAQKGVGILNELGAAFLLPLDGLTTKQGDIGSALRKGLVKYDDKLKELKENKRVLPDDLLANLLGPDREKLWLVVYDAPSLTMALYDEGGAGVLKKFLDEPGKGRPKVFFVASDYHHQLFLDETFINPKPEAAETSKR